MLTALPISTKEWIAIARNAGVANDADEFEHIPTSRSFPRRPKWSKLIANRLRDREAIKRAKVFPYQLLIGLSVASSNAEIPRQITEALQDAMEIATENVPQIEGKIYVLPDVSGSMSSAVTGYRKGATTSVRCIDVAGLVASAILRKNPMAEVLPFENDVVKLALNPRDSVMTNAQKLAAIGGGGTNCSAPLAQLNKAKAKGDLVIYVSDNESWIDNKSTWNSGTETMNQWNEFKSRNRERETRLH